MQNTHDVDVPIEIAHVVQPADDVHFGATVFDCFLPTGEDLLIAHHVTLRVAQVGAERTEYAAVNANVRWVEMRVDVVIGEVAVFALANEIGEFADFWQRHIGTLKYQPIFERKPLAGFDFVADQFKDW